MIVSNMIDNSYCVYTSTYIYIVPEKNLSSLLRVLLCIWRLLTILSLIQVNPVVLGEARACQDQLFDTNGSRVMPLLLHGDASMFQGSVRYNNTCT